MRMVLVLLAGFVAVFGFMAVFDWFSWLGKCSYRWVRTARRRGQDGREFDVEVPMRCTFDKGHVGPHGTRVFEAPDNG
jgi:hypothetical protein